MNGLQILRTEDFAEGVALAAVVRRATEIRRQDLDYLAETITNKIADAWNNGQK